MRVKTMPKQRIIQSNDNVESVSEVSSENVEKSPNEDGKEPSKNVKSALDALDDRTTSNSKAKELDNPDANDDEDKEVSNYSSEVLDMSIKRKDDAVQVNPANHSSMAGSSSCCQYSDSSSEDELQGIAYSDDNNNTSLSVTDVVDYCSLAGPSCSDFSKSHEDESDVQKDDSTSEAVNLCKRDHHEEDASNPSGGSDDRLKDTFLYKIMTDPTFLESIQKHKQAKKYVCQFCKQEFANSDELTDHMDVKKDDANQVVCCACRKTFAQKRYLRYHQRCHSERTKFTCAICTKKYTRLDNLTRHNTFHVNPDKFSCSYCEKTFARKDLLNKHLKCHDNKYRFYCETCQKYFKGPVTLDNHKKIFHSVA